jgi:hypothetical protein
MKKTIFFFLFSLAITGLWAQTSLPTSFSDFSQPLPTGWSYWDGIGSGVYTSGSDATPACRLDATGEYLEISFSDIPGTLTYYMKGTSMTPPPAFTGSFTIEESVNGTTWTTLQNYTAMNSAFTMYTNNPASTSRYVRFYYTTKVAGSNVALDQISLTKAALPIDINIKQGNTNIINGGTFSIGNSASTVFKVQNLGVSGALNISSYPITGTDASMFGIAGMPASVAFNDSLNFTLNFTPTGVDGSKHCIITINSNDPNDPVYVINIYAIKGTLATEPTAQPTVLNFTNIKSYTFNVGYTAATPAPENYIVLIKRGNAFTSEEPVDATTYHKGDYIGGAQVAYIGSGTSFTPNFIVANTNYYLKVFSFNGPAGFENYLLTSPLAGNTATTNGAIGSTYSGVSSSSPTFVTQLHSVVYPHTQIYYSNYASNMITNGFESRDTVNGQTVVSCHYTDFNYVYSGVFSWGTSTGELTREHTYCKSWMPLSITEDSIPYSDLHNLFPAEFTHANSVRSNYPLGEVVTVISTWMGDKFGTNNLGQTVFEPKDSQKGDAARAMMYVSICYTGIAGNLWSIPSQQDQNILKKWHFQDPPDNWEIARNDYINWKQGNRNPFVDSVDYVCHIDFSNMTYISNPGNPCFTVGVNELNDQVSAVNIYPNPSSNSIFVDFNFNKSQSATLQIADYTGKIVKEIPEYITMGQNHLNISTADLSQGVYMLKLTSQEININHKIIVMH